MNWLAATADSAAAHAPALPQLFASCLEVHVRPFLIAIRLALPLALVFRGKHAWLPLPEDDSHRLAVTYRPDQA